MGSLKSSAPAKRFIGGLLLVLLAMLLLIAGWTIPFQFESYSILYKFGISKALLRGGKIIGITMALLLFYQMLLASHLQLLQQLFSQKLLSTLHRYNGFLITLLIVVHPLLIKASEDFVPYAFEPKYYPEFVGIATLLITLTVVSLPALLRKRLGLILGKGWLFFHRLGATLALLLLPLHVLWVSDTFKSGLPHNAALVIFTINVLLLIRIWLGRIFSSGKKAP